MKPQILKERGVSAFRRHAPPGLGNGPSTLRAQLSAPHASPGRPRRGECQERGAEGAGAGAPGQVPRAARHSPMRLKLSDKVLRNFFILPIFSAGCGSMRSHIWATPGHGNFPKLVQSGAQTTARARDTGKAAPPPPPPPPPPAGRRRARLGRRAAGRRLGSGLGHRGTGGGVLRGAGGGRGRRCRSGSAPHRRRPAHFPSFVTELRGGQWGRRGWRRGAGGWGQGAGAGDRRGCGARAGRSSQPRVLGAREKAAVWNRHPPRLHRPSRRRRRHRRRGPASPSVTGPRRRTAARPRPPARSPRPQWPGPARPAAPPSGRPRAPPPPGRPACTMGDPGRCGGRKPSGLGAGRDWGPCLWP